MVMTDSEAGAKAREILRKENPGKHIASQGALGKLKGRYHELKAKIWKVCDRVCQYETRFHPCSVLLMVVLWQEANGTDYVKKSAATPKVSMQSLLIQQQ